MTKTVTLRIDSPLHQLLTRQAHAEHRSLANLLQLAARHYIEQAEWASDDEMQAITRDPQLVKKLRRGSADAARRKGTLLG